MSRAPRCRIDGGGRLPSQIRSYRPAGLAPACRKNQLTGPCGMFCHAPAPVGASGPRAARQPSPSTAGRGAA
jgi:hypothetical protein